MAAPSQLSKSLVLSKNESTGEVAAKRVTHTFVRQAPGTLALTFSNGERIETTAEHPFYVESEGFVPAGLLALGNSIVTRAGPSLQVAGIEKKQSAQTVYNFSVADFHTYFVGQSALWVHNAAYGSLSELLDFVAKQPGNGVEKVRMLMEGLEKLPGTTFDWELRAGILGTLAFGKPGGDQNVRPMLYIDEAGNMWEGFETAIQGGVVDTRLMRQRPFNN